MIPPIVLLAHGSPDPRHAADVDCLATALQRRLADLATPATVRAAFLEHDRPLSEVVPRLWRSDGVVVTGRRPREPVRVVPLFLSAGYHVRHDVPAQLAQADADAGRADGPSVVGVRPPLMTGAAPWTVAALTQSVHRDAAGAGAFATDTETAVVVVTAGTTDPSVLEAWDRAARRWTQDGPWGAVEVAHASGPGRRAHVAVEGMRRRGLVVDALVPAVVASGFFADRIAKAAADLGVRAATIVGGTEAFLARLAATCQSSAASPQVAPAPSRRT